MIRLTQYDGTTLTLDDIPSSIVSLVPSTTETLLQYGACVIGRTSFCIEPASMVSRIPVVGGTKTPKLKKILELCPELVVANQEENRHEDIQTLVQHGIKVWVHMQHNIFQVSGYLRELLSLCRLGLGRNEWISSFESSLQNKTTRSHSNKRAAILIWKDPWMMVGRRTYMGSMLEAAGYVNGLTDLESRYPTVSVDELKSLALDYLFLTTEPFHFTQAHVHELHQIVGNTVRIKIVKGEDLTWPGPRLLAGLDQLMIDCDSYAV